MGQQDGSENEPPMMVLAKDAGYSNSVHIATGMVAVQAGCSTAAALARIMGHAAEQEWSVDRTARDVVDRRLRFD